MTAETEISEKERRKRLAAACIAGAFFGGSSGLAGGMYSGNPAVAALTAALGGGIGCTALTLLEKSDMDK